MPADPDSYLFLLDSFGLALGARNRAPKTVRVYRAAALAFEAYLRTAGRPTAPTAITRQDIEGWMRHLLTTPGVRTGHPASPAHANHSYRALQAFFKWLVEDEQVLTVSPFAHTHPPTIPDNPPPALRIDQVQALLATCGGREHTTFYHRRDYAILLMFLDCGLRRAELVGLQLSDLDWTPRPPLATVTGKARRTRAVPLGVECALAVRRYLRMRAAHPSAAEPALWLGRMGVLGYEGVKEVLDRRRDEAGLKRLYPHLLRHTYAHLCLAAGAQEGELMALGGWRGSEMLRLYGRSESAARAQKAHSRFSPGDQVRTANEQKKASKP